MRYLLLIYTPEPTETDPGVPMGSETEAYNRVTEELRTREMLLGGEALHPTTAATTVRVRDGQTLTTDGPFAETKEALGGFYLIEAKDLDDAIDIAAKIPGAGYGSIEVRPIFEYGVAAGSEQEAIGAAG